MLFTINEYCLQCGRLGLTYNVRIYGKGDETEAKIQYLHCTNDCRHSEQRDLTQIIISRQQARYASTA